MRFRDTIICLFCVLVAGGLLIIAGNGLDEITAARKEMKLIATVEPLENAPPSLAFATVAMGAFRGLVVDLLWLRAEQLKQDGQFFDAKQIAEWITILQPRFASVWVFQAWNMAYNISVAMPASQPEERWRWVQNGISLLRDQGIERNPKNIDLYRELAWIFHHKIGNVSDEVHRYYKLQLAVEMEDLVGSQTEEYFEALAKSPKQWSGILAVPGVEEIVNTLKQADPTFADDEEFVNNYLLLRRSPGVFESRAFEVIDHYRGTEALVSFDVFARAWKLRNKHKLEPELMVAVNKTLGPISWSEPGKHLPFDWRNAHTHAIYWAVKGLEVAGKDVYTAEEIFTDRIVYQSLQELFRSGKIFIYDVPIQQQTPNGPVTVTAKSIFLKPDLRFFETYDEATLKVIDKWEELKGTAVSQQDGHRNMLKSATLAFYQANKIEKAGEIYQRLRTLYPRDEFKPPLIDFVREMLELMLTDAGLDEARGSIMMLLQDSYFRYAVRDDEEAFGREKMAREIYQYYAEQVEVGEEARIGLPPFATMMYFALESFVQNEMYPENMRKNLLGRLKIERPDLFKKLKAQKNLYEEPKDSQETP